MTATYAWTPTERRDTDAVTVTVSLSGDRVVADVAWPPNGQNVGRQLSLSHQCAAGA